jgi:hypothetical protein
MFVLKIQEPKNTCVNFFRFKKMSSNEILIQCQAHVSKFYLYIYIIDYIIDVVYFRTTFSNALWTEIFETSDVRNMI